MLSHASFTLELTLIFPLTKFSLTERYDHSPDNDHTDNITGLACCPRLKVFATSSRDGTVRIWNSFNVLIRLYISIDNLFCHFLLYHIHLT